MPVKEGEKKTQKFPSIEWDESQKKECGFGQHRRQRIRKIIVEVIVSDKKRICIVHVFVECNSV